MFSQSDETTVARKCYPAMKHESGDIIEVRDCVLLKAGQKKNELPFVAKIASLWENPEDGKLIKVSIRLICIHFTLKLVKMDISLYNVFICIV